MSDFVIKRCSDNWDGFFYVCILCFLIGSIFFYCYNIALIYAGFFTVGTVALMIVLIGSAIENGRRNRDE